MAKDQKEITELCREARKQGWAQSTTGTNHIRLRSPEGKVVILPASPGGHRSTMNIKANLRRAGLILGR